MSLILTCPARLKIMLIDASTLTRQAYDIFPNDVDNIVRPAWYVGVDSANYPPRGAGIETPAEIYRLELIGLPYGTGLSNEQAETDVRTIVDQTLRYFFAREQLQFSNLRTLEPAPLKALSGVQWARITSRTGVGTFSRQGVEGEYWGSTLMLTVESAFKFDQVLIAN